MKTLIADNEVALTKHEAAIDRLQASNEKAIEEFRTDCEKFRTDMEQSVNSFTVRMMGAIGLLGVFITILHFFK